MLLIYFMGSSIYLLSLQTKMKIAAVSKVFIRPSFPTPLQLHEFNLSFIDEMIPPSYIPLILFYSFNKNKNFKQSEIAHRLKNSLSEALVRFYPLAGRIKSQSSVDCNDEGVLYIEAYADGMILALTECPENSLLDKLFPCKHNGSISNSEELLAIQVTFFKCGSISIGICISHRISDGFTLSSFIKFWADNCLGDRRSSMCPFFNAATLFPPRMTPDFRPNFKSLSVLPPIEKLVTKRFVFSASAIDALKMKVTKNSSIVKPTRVEVLSGILWYHCLQTKGLKKTGKSAAFYPVNLRRRIPNLSQCSFGNLFQMTKAITAVEELRDWIQLAEKLRDAFKRVDGEYINKLLGQKGFDLAKDNFMEISKYLGFEEFEVFRFSSYCRFPLHEADFGWGKPVWLSRGSLCIKNAIDLFDSVKSPGGIEACIVMADQEMKKLQQVLENFCIG